MSDFPAPRMPDHATAADRAVAYLLRRIQDDPRLAYHFFLTEWLALLTAASPKPGFDWTRVKWGGPNDPVSLDCSYCSAAIPEEACPLRLWTEHEAAAVFCDACAAEWFGLQSFPAQADEDYPEYGGPQDWPGEENVP